MDWVKRLTKEKSLFQVYKSARLAAYSKYNVITTTFLFTFLILCGGLNAYFGEPITSHLAFVEGVKEVADIGFIFTTTILGFLISGFAIFAGISKPEILILLAKTDHVKYPISELQFVFFNFMLVFIHYLVYMLICVMLKASTFDGGPLPRAISLMAETNWSAGWAMISVVFALILSWLFFAVLLLKSFIWNLYQAVLITVLLESELQDRRAANEGGKQT